MPHRPRCRVVGRTCGQQLRILVELDPLDHGDRARRAAVTARSTRPQGCQERPISTQLRRSVLDGGRSSAATAIIGRLVGALTRSAARRPSRLRACGGGARSSAPGELRAGALAHADRSVRPLVGADLDVVGAGVVVDDGVDERGD
jgi:hypothetical protein